MYLAEKENSYTVLRFVTHQDKTTALQLQLAWPDLLLSGALDISLEKFPAV